MSGKIKGLLFNGLLAMQSIRTGNISSTLSLILFFQIWSLFVNPSILFWLIKMFVFLPRSEKFSPLRLKISARYASFPNQISLETNKAKFLFCGCKKSNNPSSVQTGVLRLFRGKAIELLYAAKDSSALILVHCKVVKTIETEVDKF